MATRLQASSIKWRSSNWLEVLFADAREIHQALADFADALRHAKHAGQAFQRGGVVGSFGELFDGALQAR